MIALIVRSFLRSNGVKIGLLFLLTAGVVSLFVGKQFLERQRETIGDVLAFQQEDFKRSAVVHQDELGLLLYYLKFSLVNKTAPISGLSIGQRDVNPSVQSVTIRALEGQKYDADLTNPNNLLLGNIDFSFVLVYLFPLVIISFTYNLISAEKENGTWKIVAVQSRYLFLFVLQLFAVRLLVLLGILAILVTLAVPWLGIPLDGVFFAFLGTSVLYLVFWMAVCFWVTSLQRSSSFNAMLLLTIWLNLLILLPAAINTYIVTRYPVPEALSTTLKQRKGYHEKWDMDKKGTMVKFYAHYPRFKTYPLPNKEFSWLWYYAMQQLGDDESAQQAGELRQKMQQRETASLSIAQFIPTLHTQLQLNELARSGLGNQLRFLDNTSQFHETLRLYFYPKIFSDTPVKAFNWEKFAVETFSDRSPIAYSNVFTPLMLFIGLFTGLGWLMFRRSLYRL